MLDKDEFEGGLAAVFVRLRNTAQKNNNKKTRNDVTCMTQNYGPATFLITKSLSKWMRSDLGECIREVNGPEIAYKNISELVAFDHVSTSRFIDKFTATLDIIFGDDNTNLEVFNICT